MEIIKRGNLSFLTSEKINIPHGFSLREGGVSEECFDSLNVGLRRGDNPFNAMENIRMCCEALSMNERDLTSTYQLHTNTVKVVGKEDINKGIFREWTMGVDGVVTKEKNVPLMCYSADCVPTLFYDPKAQIIGAVHGGWRGTKDNIVKNAVECMEKEGSVKEDIIAFIGPAIGMCCYEVSEDVGREFSEYSQAVIKKDNGKYMLDLKAVTKMQLVNAGLKEENVENSLICTSCENDKFFSHRKGNGKSGLLGGFIQLV